MKEYNYIISGMDYFLNEQPSRHYIRRDEVTLGGEKAQGNHRTGSPIRAALIAVINLVTH